MMKLGNFDTNHVETVMNSEGYYDAYNANKDDLQTEEFSKIVKFRKSGVSETTETSKDQNNNVITTTWRWYEFCFSPNIGFLADTTPLLTDSEVSICFERAKPEVALIEIEDNMELDYLEIHDCKAVTEYITSPNLRAHFQKIQSNPIVYEFDNIDVMKKQLTVTDTIVRIDHLRLALLGVL